MSEDIRSDVEYLLFPVKLGRLTPFVHGRGRSARTAFAFAGGMFVCACGYRSALSNDALAGKRLSVVAGAATSPHPEALQSAVAGARAELAREGALGGAPFPRLVVEIVRVDELPAGMAAPRNEGPLARGSDVGVTVRAFIEEREGAPAAHDSADVRRVETVAQGAESLPSGVAAADAIRSAARAAGSAAARRVLGTSEPSIEPM